MTFKHSGDGIASALPHLRTPSGSSPWALVYEDTGPPTTWKDHARQWLTRFVDDLPTASFPVVEVDGDIVATAVGTLQLGVPNPQCPRGRTVRLATLIAVPEHRGRGYADPLVRDVVAWARSIDADRVDLSATPEGRRLTRRSHSP